MAPRPSNGEAHAGPRTGTGPTYPPPQPPGLSPVLTRNIQALERRRRRDEQEATAEERIAEAITRFTGSMRFVYLHLAFFGFWIVANLGWLPGVPAWDPSLTAPSRPPGTATATAGARTFFCRGGSSHRRSCASAACS